MDESPKQLIKQTRIPIARRPGQNAKEDYEYSRQGVVNIFMANEPLKGKRYVKITSQKTKKDWAYFIRYIADKLYPKAEKIILIMDNLNTHKPLALYETFPPEEAKRIWDRFLFNYTPKHGSCLNMAEIELRILMGQCLNRRIDKACSSPDAVVDNGNSLSIICEEITLNSGFEVELGGTLNIQTFFCD